ncbi:methyltransferase domain-containing protein [Labrys okinawensis]|uniref:class I SAM-dependent DNA methyltransferase n=1 Tax=Labrys okinawensis TaxID=346911 RepID=UPI0039BD5A98
MHSFHTSGDPIADRRFAYAMDYKAQGDLAAAAELVEQTLDCAPRWAAGWYVLGDLREEAGERSKAIEAYRQSLAFDASDVAGAGARLARLGERPADGAMTASHVAALFDEYAPRFEHSLVGDLSYRGPALLKAALSELRQPLAFRRMLDLGCGTGLAGEALQACCAEMIGVDLSQAMLAKAGNKSLYRDLICEDALAFLESQPAASAELVLAADVFVYLGDLQALFNEVARVLEPNGLFAFTAQRHDGPEPFILNHDMRYAHSHAGMETWARTAGLTLLCRNDEWARQDRGIPVPGMVAIFAQ